MSFVTVTVNWLVTASVNVVPRVTTCLPSASTGSGAVKVTLSPYV